MKVLIIDGFTENPFSQGKLNASFTACAQAHFEAKGAEVQISEIDKGYDIEAEISAKLEA